MRFLAPQWLGAMQVWEQPPWGLVQWAPAPELWKDLQLWTPQCCLFPPGICQDRVSRQLIKTQLMTAGRSASRTLGILVHGSLSFEVCLPAQSRWEEVSV